LVAEPLHTRAPAETLAILLPALARFGITRLANITGLDSIGLPVWQAIRPNSRSLAVAQGKGADDTSAKVSAIMESLESFHAENAACDEVKIAAYAMLNKIALVADPTRLPLSQQNRFHPDAVLPWARGEVFASGGERIYVPFELVHANFTVPRIPFSGAFTPSTNGLCAGNTREEALLHGVCELIERDAEALWRIGGEETKTATRVDVATISPTTNTKAHDYIDLFRRAGLELLIWDLTSDIGVACFSVVVFDLESDPDLNPRPAAEGSGCHPDREIALCRALAEAAQGRLTSIAGSRDDFSTARYEVFQSRESLAAWRREVSAPSPRGFMEVPHHPGAGLDLVVQRLAAKDITQIVSVDLSQKELLDGKLVFLRVLVPGLEGSIASPSYTPGARALAKVQG